MTARIPLLIAAIIAILGSGCAGDLRTDGRSGGVRIELLHEGAGNLVQYFRIDSGGALHFGGGKDALRREASWTGAMTDEELSSLIDYLEQEQLFTRKPASTGEPRRTRTELQIIGPPGRQTIRTRGECPSLDHLRALLLEISQRRLDPFMRTLPAPTQEESPPANTDNEPDDEPEVDPDDRKL